MATWFSALADDPAFHSLDLKAEHKVERLEAHWDLVRRWGQVNNLTSVLDSEVAAEVHYRDALHLAQFLVACPRVSNRATVVDIGSGAGFPGVPLALAVPDFRVTWLEPRRKRVSFLRTVRARLGLDSVTVRAGKSEDLQPQEFEVAVMRAVFSDLDRVRSCLRGVAPGGVLIAMRVPTPGTSHADEQYLYDVSGMRRSLDIWYKDSEPADRVV